MYDSPNFCVIASPIPSFALLIFKKQFINVLFPIPDSPIIKTFIYFDFSSLICVNILSK